MKIGIDIVEIARLAKAIDNGGDTFLHHVYTEAELKAVPQNPKRRMEYLAGRWAAKEAVAKALGCGIGAKCSLLDICILNNGDGAPEVTLSGNGAKTAADSGLDSCNVSISHEENYAVAMAVFEQKR